MSSEPRRRAPAGRRSTRPPLHTRGTSSAADEDHGCRAPENNWYPHYIHNLDNLIRFGGLYPPIHVHADLRRTVLLGATWVSEGGCMAVRASDKIFRMEDLKGKKIG